MKRELLMFALASFATICIADDAQNPVPDAAVTAAAANAAQRAARPRQVAPGQRSTTPMPLTDGAPDGAADRTSPTAAASGANAGTATSATSTPTDPKFASEAKWVLAGYNSDEIVYTVFVTNQDPPHHPLHDRSERLLLRERHEAQHPGPADHHRIPEPADPCWLLDGHGPTVRRELFGEVPSRVSHFGCQT